ncbi:hypothetical protein AGMMS50239_02210 [Bacteroidia bacterium]|nr:hypothetical protein AGMMS50239_02210 [Bacteroidia bacterium]
MKNSTYLLLSFFVFLLTAEAYSQIKEGQTIDNDTFLFETNRAASIYIDTNEKQVVHTAVSLLQQDVSNVFNASLQTAGHFSDKIQILAGTIGQNPEITRLINEQLIDVLAMEGKWESFSIIPLENCLVIVGSDSRGTAYGLLELSRLIGVSPWHYFADVHPDKADFFRFPQTEIRQSPSVRYRGIFLNDEDWGLMPWATKTLASGLPLEGGLRGAAIGPEAYEKIFELLLRLRANTIWPAMHECTVPFYLVKGNKEMADKYGIVVGTSHCEPMMRCSASEWDIAGQGEYNYVTNKENVQAYWIERLKDLKGAENIYTIGMRGKHDGMMQGVKTLEEHKFQLQKIINDQQELLSKQVNPNRELVPQVFIPYKEVLDVYDAGLEVPDYTTLVWCDDNYGYIRRLSDEKERLRSGGSGVYYHVSYWGRPHDYLWLASTSPALVYTEMQRAYQHGADRLWILNVGDIKPAEYLMEFFLDMAWNGCENIPVFNHLNSWATREFGAQNAPAVTRIMKEYYRLANFRKPEHTGYNRVEESGYPRGLTPVQDSELNPATHEPQDRIESYLSLESQVNRLKPAIPDNKRSAFFQLVEYPVKGASLINQKWLYAQLGDADKSLAAYREIERITDDYNQMENGKWNRIMDFHPRNLPVFDAPDTSVIARATPETIRQHFTLTQNACQSINIANTGKIIEGLGHSFSAVQLKQNDSLSFVFDIPEAGEAQIEIASLPNHDVDGQGMKIALSVDGKELTTLDYSVTGRSEPWKQNVLRGQALSVVKYNFQKAGKVIITVKALTSYIILDQIMISKINPVN